MLLIVMHAIFWFVVEFKMDLLYFVGGKCITLNKNNMVSILMYYEDVLSLRKKSYFFKPLILPFGGLYYTVCHIGDFLLSLCTNLICSISKCGSGFSFNAKSIIPEPHSGRTVQGLAPGDPVESPRGVRLLMPNPIFLLLCAIQTAQKVKGELS